MGSLLYTSNLQSFHLYVFKVTWSLLINHGACLSSQTSLWIFISLFVYTLTACNPTCLTCSTYEIDGCTSCRPPLLLLNGFCVRQCGDDQYNDGGICLGEFHPFVSSWNLYLLVFRGARKKQNWRKKVFLINVHWGIFPIRTYGQWNSSSDSLFLTDWESPCFEQTSTCWSKSHKFGDKRNIL